MPLFILVFGVILLGVLAFNQILKSIFEAKEQLIKFHIESRQRLFDYIVSKEESSSSNLMYQIPTCIEEFDDDLTALRADPYFKVLLKDEHEHRLRCYEKHVYYATQQELHLFLDEVKYDDDLYNRALRLMLNAPKK